MKRRTRRGAATERLGVTRSRGKAICGRGLVGVNGVGRGWKRIRKEERGLKDRGYLG